MNCRGRRKLANLVKDDIFFHLTQDIHKPTLQCFGRVSAERSGEVLFSNQTRAEFKKKTFKNGINCYLCDAPFWVREITRMYKPFGFAWLWFADSSVQILDRGRTQLKIRSASRPCCRPRVDKGQIIKRKYYA